MHNLPDRDTFVFHRRLDRALPRAVCAEGVWIEDAEGKRYIEASGGPICVNVFFPPLACG